MGEVISMLDRVRKQAEVPAEEFIQVPTDQVLELMLQAVAHPEEAGSRYTALACFYALSSQLETFLLDVTPELMELVEERKAGIIDELENELESRGQL